MNQKTGDASVVQLPEDWYADEKGNVWLSADGQHNAWLRVGPQQWLELSIRLENYPGLTIGRRQATDFELSRHIRRHCACMYARTLNLDGIVWVDELLRHTPRTTIPAIPDAPLELAVNLRRLSTHTKLAVECAAGCRIDAGTIDAHGQVLYLLYPGDELDADGVAEIVAKLKAVPDVCAVKIFREEDGYAEPGVT